MNEVYISTDCELDGPIPGPHSMLSFASAAFTADKSLLGTFSANLETLPGATADPSTMEFWSQHPKAWEACRQNPRPPQVVMPEYARWVKSLPGTPVFLSYPGVFDFMFVYWYLIRFVGESPFSHSALDIKTYAMALTRSGYHEVTKRTLPQRWLEGHSHTHVALDDAIGQGILFCNMLLENLGSR
jgi:hypothetical protein